MPKASSQTTKRTFQNPKGTRDFYPDDQLRQRYITDAWRRVALRHGFEEVGGPTFEHLDLYTVKSGEGIVSELFSFTREGGDDTYALRPEFTPTLARMYAARAKQLPAPVRWFSICNYFRAERPQRGRLREFLQWNCDVIGLGGGDSNTEGTERTEKRKAEADGELVAVCIELFREYGLTQGDLTLFFYHRAVLEQLLVANGLRPESVGDVFVLVDRRERMPPEEFESQLTRLAGSARLATIVLEVLSGADPRQFAEAKSALAEQSGPESVESIAVQARAFAKEKLESAVRELNHLAVVVNRSGMMEWCAKSSSIVRGLAYYTGTVFEAIAEGERAVAGGGRYDNLIELMGGPPTPAAGFAMGDVVLGNILDDKGLIPEGQDLLEALSRPMPVRPDVFVASLNEEADGAIVPLVSSLRRGVQKDDAPERKPWAPEKERYAIRPLHARRSYRSLTTKNLDKVRAKHRSDASAQHARFCVILETEETCTIKDLDLQKQTDKPVALGHVGPIVAGVESID